MDLVFLTLQILYPTLDEIEMTQKGILKLEEIWRKLDLNITPKCHILFHHTIDEMRKYNVMTDLAEDFIEQSHQTRKKLDLPVAHITNQCFCQQELVKIWPQLLANDPLILKQ